jgi:hypothetical protein
LPELADGMQVWEASLLMDFLNEWQITSLKNVLPKALEYHYSNFQRLETLAERYVVRQDEGATLTKIEDAIPGIAALTNIKFEVQAYLCQLRRLKFFLKSVGLTRPADPALAEVWDSVMDPAGMVNLFANKWAAHRSFDDPRGEDEHLHAQVLLNLDSSTTIWSNEHLVLELRGHELDLCSFHPRCLEFVSWVFRELGTPS